MPGQIWVAGFGVYEIMGVPVPSRTTITPFPRKIGAWTAALILEVLDARQVGQVQGGIAPVRLIRQSSRQSVR